jgi:hypothetical protein
MHKFMNTHINTHINNINTHNLYLRWRAARRRRDERAGAAGTAAGRGRADGAWHTAEEGAAGGAAGTAHGRGKVPAWGGRGGRQTARRRAQRRRGGAGREERKTTRERRERRKKNGRIVIFLLCRVPAIWHSAKIFLKL